MAAQDWSAVDCVLFDVDGVLTDAGLPYTASDSHARVFSSRDGAMLRLSVEMGLRVGLCSGRRSPAVERRSGELGLDPVLLGADDKVAVIADWAAETGIGWEHICFCGDDLPDLGPLLRAGLAVAVADANPAIRRQVDWVTSRPGGRGAAAELLERLLRAKGLWEQAMLRCTGSHG